MKNDPPKTQRCTCPSGDGSLRWPCPTHPAEAQAVACDWPSCDCTNGRAECGRKISQTPSAPTPVAGDAVAVIEEMRSRMSSRGRVGEGPVYGGELIDWANRLEAALAQPPADAHCTTCSCVPGMTPAVRLDATPAEKDGAVRDHLIRMGWTPPSETQPVGEAGSLPGSNGGFTTAVFKASDVPMGTKLYTAPPSTSVGVEWVMELADEYDTKGKHEQAYDLRALAQQPGAKPTNRAESSSKLVDAQPPAEAQLVGDEGWKLDPEPMESACGIHTYGIDIGEHGMAIEVHGYTPDLARARAERILAAVAEPSAPVGIRLPPRKNERGADSKFRTVYLFDTPLEQGRFQQQVEDFCQQPAASSSPMTRSTNMEHVAHLQRMANESWIGSPERAALDAAIASLSAPQPPAEARSVGVEGHYHPCTHILIEGLKRLDGGSAVLAEWDAARSESDAQQPAAVDEALVEAVRALAKEWRADIEASDMSARADRRNTKPKHFLRDLEKLLKQQGGEG